jgi:hypothetical protein
MQEGLPSARLFVVRQEKYINNNFKEDTGYFSSLPKRYHASGLSEKEKARRLLSLASHEGRKDPFSHWATTMASSQT